MERQYGYVEIKTLLEKICDTCIEKKEILTEIDSKLGDGDMGISMERGAKAIKNLFAQENEKSAEMASDITKLFASCGIAFNRAAPSTLGTLISFSLMEIGKQANHSAYLSEEQVANIPSIMAETIAKRGKANVGDKTILDALIPYAKAMKENFESTRNLQMAVEQAVMAAKEGMESTKGMKAKTGRASWLDSRNMEYPDAGSVLCVVIAETVANRESSR